MITIPNFNRHRKLDKISHYLSNYVFSSIFSPPKFFEWSNETILGDKGGIVPEDSFIENFLDICYSLCVAFSPSLKSIFIDTEVKNCEYIDRLVVALNYREDCVQSCSGYTSHNNSNIMCLGCDIPNVSSKDWISSYYMDIASTVRHELQHSYQSLFMNEIDALRDARLRVSMFSISPRLTAPTPLESEYVYFMDLDSEKEARIKSWKFLARKQNASWLDIMEKKIRFRANTLVEDFLIPKQSADLFYNQAIKAHLEFERLYGHFPTYLQKKKAGI